MKHWIRLLCLSLLSIVVGTASAQNVAKIGSTEYATIEEAIAEWGPGKTLTLLADVTTTSTVTVEVNATKSTQNWTLNLGDYTWTANGCNAFQLYAAGGTVMNQNYGLIIYANQNGGITASGKYCIEAKYDNSKTRYRPRLEIHGGTYEGGYIIYYYSSQWNNTNIENGPSTHIFKSNDGTEPIFNGNFGMFKCPLTINAGYFNGTSFNTYPVGSTADTYLKGGHFKTYSAFPSANNNKGIIFGDYKVFVKNDASIDVINGAPSTYEAKATKNLLLSSNQGVNYSDYVYYEKANDAIQNSITNSNNSTVEIILSQDVTATQDKTISRSGTLTIDATAEGSSYTGNVVLADNSAKLVMKFPEGGGHYGVSVNSGTLHVEESITDGIVTRTYSRIATISNPEAKVDDISYSTVYDAFYAIDGSTDNKTIVLQKDVTNAGIVTNGTSTGGDGKTVATFDLNGKSIGIGSAVAGNNADYTLTIIDSSEGKTGTVTNSDASLFILALTGISDYSGSYTLKVQGGTWQFDPSSVNVNGEIHNLVDEGYVSRDNGNDTWTVVEITPVAKIGETKYGTLQAALDAAHEMTGDVTVELLEDIDTYSIVHQKAGLNLTIDGAEKNVSGNIIVDGDGRASGTETLTIQNIKFEGDGTNFCSGTSSFVEVPSTKTSGTPYYTNKYNYAHNITITDCSFTSTTSGLTMAAVRSTSGAGAYNVTINNSTGTNLHSLAQLIGTTGGSVTNNTVTGSESFVNVNGGAGDFTISGNTFTSAEGADGYGIRENGTSSAVITLTDNTFTATSAVVLGKGDSQTAGTINVESGIYNGAISKTEAATGKIVVSGGYFSEEVAQEHIVEGKVCVSATDKPGYFTIGDPHYVAQIGETKYVSLQAALDAAHNMSGNVTIELIDNIEGYSIVHQKAGLNLTIDGTDKTVAGQIIIDGDGRASGTETLTIQNIKFEGKGTDFYTGTDAFILVPSTKTEGTPYYTNKYNYAHNITINNCSLTSTDENYSEVVGFKSTSGATCYNLVVSNVTGTNLHSLAQLTATEGATFEDCSATQTGSFIGINGGSGSDRAYTITGCSFESHPDKTDGYAIRQKSSSTIPLTLSNNNFKAFDAIILGSNATITVESGTYIGNVSKTAGTIVISGGQFSADLTDTSYEPFIAEGKIGVQNNAVEGAPYSVEEGSYVAQVTLGETTHKYGSLEAAIAAATDGSTVKLLDDCAGNGIVVSQGKYTTGLTVDFAGFTYTVDGETVGSTGTETNGFQLLKDNKITFKNGTITSTKAKILVQNYSDLTLEGMTLTLNNENYTSAYTLSNNNGNVVIDGTTITANPAGGFAFDVCRYSSYPSVSVTVKGESVINGDVEVSASGSDAKDGFTLMLESGTISGNIVVDASAGAAMTATPTKAIIKENDSFNQDAPVGYMWVSDGEGTGTSTLAPRPYVAQIGDVKYWSLAEAVAAVPTDGTETTITMIGDEAVEAGITIAAGKNVVLELNGKTISGNTDSSKTYALITNRGTLVILDNTDTNKDGTGTGLITTYISNPDGGDVPGYASNTITNNGNLTVKSGKIVNNGSGYACYAIDNQTNGTSYSPVLKIEGGRMQQMNEYTYAVRMFANSTTNVNTCEVSGGVIEGGYGLWLQTPNNKANKADLKITGGTINANDGAALYIGGTKADNSNITIDIAGGQINGTGVIIQGPLSGTYGSVSISDGEIVNVKCGDNVEKFISGGVFKNSVQEAYCAEGYIPSENTDEATKAQYPYTVKTGAYVAAIDDVKYETLEAAIEAAETGQTITLLKDIDATAQVEVGKQVTLDLNGKTIEYKGSTTLSSGVIMVLRGGDLTVTDSSEGAAGAIKSGTNAYAGIALTKAGETSTETAKLTVNNGTIEGYYYAITGNGSRHGTEITIAGGVIKGTCEGDNVGIFQPQDGTLTITGGEIFGVSGVELRSGTLTVTGGSISSTSDSYSYEANGSGTTTKGAAIAIAQHSTVKAITANITGATLSGTKLISVVDTQGNNLENVEVTASDDYIDNTEIPADFKWVSNGENTGTSTLTPKTYVAQIGDVKYESLAEAVAAVPTDGTQTTITMIANEAIDVIGYAVTIPTTKNVVLDLNGFQVVGTASEGNTSALITNKGTLTIKDSSDTNADGTGTGKLASGATSTWTWDGTDDYSGSYASNLIRNEGTLVVESGNLYNMSTGSASYAIDNYSAGKVTINGGKIDAAKASAIRLFYNNGGSVTVNGGVIGRYVSDDDCTYMGIQVQNGTNANVTITGGTIDGNYAVYANNTGGKISISGGTLNSYVMFGSAGPSDISISGGAHYYVYAYGSQTKFVSGGIYAYEVDETYIADGYILTDNTDPATKDDYPYTVRAGMYIAAIGTTKYETLQAAVDAAGTAATTITLLTEAATNGVISGDGVVVPSGSNITFDLNGLTYDVAGETVGSKNTETNGFQLLQGSDITFKNGTLKATSPTAQMLIQNYSNLTLEDVNLDGTTLSGWAYALSNNCGTINLTGSTSITAKTGGRAFDTCKYADYAIPTVNINTTGAITGPIEATGGKLNIKNGKFDVTWVTDNNYTAGDIQITGGIFSEEPDEEYCAEGYVATDNEDEETKAAYPYAVMTKEDAGIYDLYDLLAKANSVMPRDDNKTPYTLEEDTPVKVVTYYREFSSTTANTRQCWFVPFDYTLTAEDLEKCTFYRIHMFSAPANQEGVVEDEKDVVMKISELTAGYTLKANKPYIIKPKADGVYEFVAENTTLKAKNTDELLSLATSIYEYDFYGVYDSYGPMAANQWFSLNTNGNLKWNSATQKLGPYRWYIKPTFTGDDYANISFIIEEEGEGDETTTIDQIFYDPNAEIEGFYTVGGIKLDKPVRGLNIVKYTDGRTKKVYVK